MIRVVSWNLARRDLWRDLHGLDADLALLQEAAVPGPGSALEVLPTDLATWSTSGWGKRIWRTAVAASPTGWSYIRVRR